MAVALIVAAGLGERLGAGRPKALVELAGRPLLHWSVDVLASVPAIERIVVALPAGVEAPAGTRGVRGGAVRSESVRLALAAAGDGRDSDLVLVHDAARPLLTVELIEATLAATEGEGVDAAIAATPVTDTVKQADEDGMVRQTLDRAGLWAVQTPQVFRRSTLERALDVPDEVLAQATDDAWLVERAGGRVVVVSAPKDNLKVTTALDLELAELLLARGARTHSRVGF
ncbi:MAG TPA: 2-C-methyl-D-erythritol 4-phosphate cytidylyltransferase [Solirubrobacteraceae bacterium]|jgi:2-C-methyl-D-erythritol 4-phosphate cytidylyltransferase|nr:2-C-methyl-D-erythritol 4-phosphate cytidylyltransferase [Solirubrobacteraceae bacterium]